MHMVLAVCTEGTSSSSSDSEDLWSSVSSDTASSAPPESLSLGWENPAADPRSVPVANALQLSM